MHVLVKGATARYYSVTDLIRDNPQTSFPAQPSAETLAEYGVYECDDTDAPTPSQAQTVVSAAPAFVDGKWQRAWALVEATPEEIDERTEVIEQTAQDVIVEIRATVSALLDKANALEAKLG